MKIRIELILLLLSLPFGAFADQSSESVFETLRGFKGKWKIESEGKTLPIEMTYDEGSKNSIVTEQFGKELSVFYMDGKSLLMTHFCNAGNQPRLRLKKNSRSARIEFELVDIKNLKNANAPHVQKVVYRVIDPKSVTLELIWKNGQATESEKYVLTKSE